MEKRWDEWNHILKRLKIVSTKIISVTEGVHLLKNGISPYDGDLFHETPLHLLVYSWLVLLKQPLLDLVFILIDATTCFFLQTLAANYTNQAVKLWLDD